MRPTLQISHWKIAVDLVETRRIQRSPAMAATNCECDHCQNWRLVFDKVLPEEITHQLNRIGIDAEFPSDSYGSGSNDGVEHFRVWFHAVGKILSGPSGWTEGKISDEVTPLRNYMTLREEPYLSLVVQRSQEFLDPPLRLDRINLKNLIQIDFRLIVPWQINS